MTFLLVLLPFAWSGADETAHSRDPAALPRPVTNNAVTAVTVGDRQYVVSFAGLGAGKRHDDALDLTLVLDSASGRWRESSPLPGGVGRLASVATSVGQLAYVFGGYTVASDGSERSTAFVHAFDPVTGAYTSLTPMPVPVDDAIAVAYRGRYVYLISGWHDLGNVNLVQRYDVSTDNWVQATPIPGDPVFGHAGGIDGNIIVYCDGVKIRPHRDRRRTFVASNACFSGTIDESDSRRIDWQRIPPHPGPPRYRMASAGSATLNGILFIGGSDNPYNYDGIGYNGRPSEPVAGGLLFDLQSRSWRQLALDRPASMDHRGLVRYAGNWLTIGGMLSGRQVSDRVAVYTLP